MIVADATRFLWNADVAQLILTDPPHADTFASEWVHRAFVERWHPVALRAGIPLVHSCGPEIIFYIQSASPDQILRWEHESGSWHYFLLYGCELAGPATLRQPKPNPLYDLFIETFTEPGDLVLDPFCGRGEIPATARALGRSYAGCDTNAASVAYCKEIGL